MWALGYYLGRNKRDRFKAQEQLTLDFMSFMRPDLYRSLMDLDEAAEEASGGFTPDDFESLDAMLTEMEKGRTISLADIDESWV